MDNAGHEALGVRTYVFDAEAELMRFWWTCQKMHAMVGEATANGRWRASSPQGRGICRIDILDVDDESPGMSIGYADGSALTVFWELLEEDGAVTLSVFGHAGLECRVLALPDDLAVLIGRGWIGAGPAATLH
jgi:hypothetical protein